MSSDFRVAVDFFTHHKARKLRRRLGPGALLSLLQLWAYAAKLRTDGNLSGMDNEDIELAAEWDGDSGVFTAALVDVGFLDQLDGVYVLHDWAENNPWVAEAKTRSDKAKKGAAARWSKSEQCESDDKQCSGNAQAMLPHDSSNAPSPSLSPEDKNSLSTPLTPHGDEQRPDQPHMPSMEWQELREHYSRVARPEGPMDGYAEFCSAKGSRTMPSPSAMYDAVERWRQSGQWDGDTPCQFAPGLGKFISRRLWAAQPQKRVRQQRDGPQQPRATTVAQQRQQERDTRSKNLLQRMGIGAQHGPNASGEVSGDRGCIDVNGDPVSPRGLLGQ